MPNWPRVVMMLVGAAALASMSGCWPGYREGGNQMSIDREVFISRTWEPKTIYVVDTRTGERVFTSELPVGRQLVVQFVEDKFPENGFNTAEMRFEEMKAGKSWGRLEHSVPVPPAMSRRLEWEMRPVPENPPTGG